ncbi:peptidase S9 [bacterium]|nr:MAG: peptidase S9 [bacterium]
MRLKMNKILIFFYISFSISIAQRPITSEDIVNLKTVSQASFHSDGSKIVYIKSIPSAKDGDKVSSFKEIWVIKSNGKDQKKYTSSSSSIRSPQWTPKGDISYLSRNKDFDKNTQIYTIPIDGGEPSILTSHDQGIISYKWSPDGKWIAFTSKDAISEKRRKEISEGYDMIVMGEEKLFTRLWIYSLKNNSIELLFKKDLNTYDFEWSPNSKQILFQATEKFGADANYLDRSIYQVRAPGGTPRKLFETPGKLSSMSISPNADKFAFLSSVSANDPLAQSIFISNFRSPVPILITDNREESYVDIEWINNNEIIAHSQRGTKTFLSMINTDKKSDDGQYFIKDILYPEEVIQSFIWNVKTERLGLIMNSKKHPNELFIGKLGSNKIQQLTFSNPELKNVALAKQESISWRSNDGKKIEGILTYPLRYGKGRNPLVLQIHGGPEGVSFDGWNTRPTYPVQLLAANGFVVLEPNYRGSGGRGVQFSKADHDDLGGAEFLDVLSGINHLIEIGLVDSEKVGTGGWSYGGYFSALAATMHSEKFKASMVGAGLTNMISFMGTTDIPREMSVTHWNQWWFDNMSLHWERSPLAHINKANTPTLIIHGMKDERVHPEQGMELWQALKIKGVETEFVLYPREPHGLLERSHKLDYMERLINWYLMHVK